MSNDPELWDEMVKEGAAFVYGAAPSASTTHWSTTWVAGLEKRGLPGVVVVYDTLIDTVRITAEMKGTPVRWVPVSYPPQKMTEKQMADVTDRVMKALTTAPTANEKKTGKYTPPEAPEIRSFRHVLPDSGLLSQAGLDRRPSHGAPDEGAGRGHAQRHETQAR